MYDFAFSLVGKYVTVIRSDVSGETYTLNSVLSGRIVQVLLDTSNNTPVLVFEDGQRHYMDTTTFANWNISVSA